MKNPFDPTGLKTVAEYIEENDIRYRDNSKLNKLFRDKIFYCIIDNAFYRTSRGSWYRERTTGLYKLGYSEVIEKIAKTDNIQTLKSQYGISWSDLNYDKLYILNEYKMTKKEQIEANIAKITQDIDTKNKALVYEQGKLKYMDENSLTEFDENEYKVYHALITLDSTASTFDKAKLIAEIIKQK